jgi:hypothetical protein
MVNLGLFFEKDCTQIIGNIFQKKMHPMPKNIAQIWSH